MSQLANLLLMCDYEPAQPQAQSIAARLGVPLVQALDWRDPSAPSFVLYLSEQGLSLKQTGKKAPGPVAAEFVSGAVAHRRKFGGGKGQMIAKAVGLNKGGQTLAVFDATAGLGRDSFVLSTLGCDVTMMERTPVVYELLLDGLSRARTTDDPELAEILARMTLLAGDSLSYLQQLTDDDKPDVVYLDPMFPERSKSASVKKEMAAFHSVVGADVDADALLPAALKAARFRVVVKRPAKAPLLNDQQPTYQLSGKTSRYDIYVNQKIS
ncbi:MAG: class I SAM-dependent methyltransferase [Candidatus Pelagadaptatus aseana]|uniref:class I SAM-dependent methyltransferase n=1 Tax=Candidatus Pelagadaptatus aseana TaxID=3120508 RepID=UPI0039B26BA1